MKKHRQYMTYIPTIHPTHMPTISFHPFLPWGSSAGRRAAGAPAGTVGAAGRARVPPDNLWLLYWSGPPTPSGSAARDMQYAEQPKVTMVSSKILSLFRFYSEDIWQVIVKYFWMKILTKQVFSYTNNTWYTSVVLSATSKYASY